MLLTGAGDLDTTFSDDGRGTFTAGQITLHAEDVAVQADGKVVVVGSGSFGRGGEWATARFNADGTPDTGFGNDGTGVIFNSAWDGEAAGGIGRAVAIQPDGGIVVVGGVVSGGQKFGIVRYLSDGSLDPSFDGDGSRITGFGAGVGGVDLSLANDVAIQHDNKIVVAGWAENGTNVDFAVVRYNPDGSLDGSFGDGGHRFIGFGDDEQVYGVAIDDSGTAATNSHYGSIVLVGDTVGSISQFAFARLTPGGDVDSSFSGDGRLAVRFVGEYDYSRATSVVVQSTGNYVIAGQVGPDQDHTNLGVIRLTADGSGDPSFGPHNGQVELDFGSGDEGAEDVIEGQTGKLLVGGHSAGQMVVACLSANGILDSRFDGDGIATTAFDGLNTSAAALALAPGGRVVAAGGDNLATARLYDRGATIAVTGLDPATTGSETGPRQASFFVTRAERLPYATRVYFTISGTATLIPDRAFDQPDYTLAGMNDVAEGGFTPYVDIPANETFAAVYLTPVDDSRVETDETAVFTINGGIPGVTDLDSPSSVTLTILDNDRQLGGTVFNDVDGNGVLDANEHGLLDWTVYLDANNNSVLDSGETRVLSNTLGRYAFGGLAPGNYIVRQVPQANWRRTLPSSTTGYSVSLAAGQVINDLDFGDTQSVRVTGTVFRDTDGDGVKDTNETGLPDVHVYIDSNNSGVFEAGELSADTDASGLYSLNGPAGTFKVRVDVPPAFLQTLPTNNGGYTITLAAGQTTSGKDFGLKPATTGRTVTSIAGSVFNDLDGDRLRDVQNPVEPNLAGWTVFLDLNKNGKLDATEPTQISDESGNFTFLVTPGVKYRVREVVPTAWTQTTLNPRDITLAQNEVATVQFGNRQTAPAIDNDGNLIVYGTEKNDTIRIDVDKKGQLKVIVDDDLLGYFNPTGRIIIYGLGGKDNIVLTTAVTRDAVIYGGAGNDKITGGGGRNILLGGDGDDLLVGRNARDVIIGGNGADSLDGSGDDDLLIAGSTLYDDDLPALLAIQSEWSTGADYNTRATNLQTGSGLAAGHALDGTTVFDDTAVDSLTGGSGQDLFYANLDSGAGLATDRLSDRLISETVLDIN